MAKKQPPKGPPPVTIQDVVSIIEEAFDRRRPNVGSPASAPMPRIAVVGLRVSQLQARRSNITEQEEELSNRLDQLEAEKSAIDTEQHELLRELDRLASAKSLRE